MKKKHLSKKLRSRQSNIHKNATKSKKEVDFKNKIYLEGQVDHVRSNQAYILTPADEEDVLVLSPHLKFAVHNDRVRITEKRCGKKKRREGEVVKILERKRMTYVGTVKYRSNKCYVIPDYRKVYFQVLVTNHERISAKNGDRVLVKIDKWHDNLTSSPIGHIANVFGATGNHEAEIHSIMAEFELPYDFPKPIENEVNSIQTTISEKEIAKRRDFRKETTFTIDPYDAKDFDDALSIRHINNSTYEIGIHIADVTHYIKPDTILDQEAIKRATSVYLIDRTIPMLPESISNGLCSLNPREEKLTFSIVFSIDTDANISNIWIGKTIIKSNQRLTYEEAQKLIEGGKGNLSKEIEILNQIAVKLRKKRFLNGAIHFNTKEIKFHLDTDNKPLKVTVKESTPAHHLIEEFMLLANMEIAHFFIKKENEPNKKFIFRVHAPPETEKINQFASFAFRFGYVLKNGIDQLSLSLNHLLEKIKNKPEQYILENIALRSMAKAKYSTLPNGHFGLALAHYTHFTSPIRRYADMVVHRLLSDYLNNGTSFKPPKESLCTHINEREEVAVHAERASIKYKQVEFMQTNIGQIFEGIVSGVKEWGVYVEIFETNCEGMIRVTDLTDDFYIFDPQLYRLKGKRHHKIITLGNVVKVQVVRTDIIKRTIDLLMVND